jgi:hypothetical protein
MGPEPSEDRADARAAAAVAGEAAIVQAERVGQAAALATAGVRDAAIAQKEGQRWTNRKWESTQSQIALMFLGTSALVAAYLAITGDREIQVPAFLFLSSTSSAIIGFYFARTNHQRVGGVGADDLGR